MQCSNRTSAQYNLTEVCKQNTLKSSNTNVFILYTSVKRKAASE